MKFFIKRDHEKHKSFSIEISFEFPCFKSKNVVSTTRPLELIHMDLCGPMRIQSRSGKKYVLVIVDDFSRFT